MLSTHTFAGRKDDFGGRSGCVKKAAQSAQRCCSLPLHMKRGALTPSKYSEHPPSSPVSQRILVPHSLQRLFTHLRPSNRVVSNRHMQMHRHIVLLLDANMSVGNDCHCCRASSIGIPIFLCPRPILLQFLEVLRGSSFSNVPGPRPERTQTNLSQAGQGSSATFAPI